MKAIITYETGHKGCQKNEKGELFSWASGGTEKDIEVEFTPSTELTDEVNALQVFWKMDVVSNDFGNTALSFLAIRKINILVTKKEPGEQLYG